MESMKTVHIYWLLAEPFANNVGTFSDIAPDHHTLSCSGTNDALTQSTTRTQSPRSTDTFYWSSNQAGNFTLHFIGVVSSSEWYEITQKITVTGVSSPIITSGQSSGFPYPFSFFLPFLFPLIL